MHDVASLYRRFVTKSMDWSLGVKAETKLLGMILRIVPLVFGHLTKGYVKVCWGYSRNAVKLYRRTGYRGLAIYLKTCYLLLQHAAGGQIARSPWELGCNVSRSRSGIPRIINSNHRKLIASGDVDTIRFWLTLFGLYRVLPFKGKLKLKTIYEPGKDINSFLVVWKAWVPTFLKRLGKEIKLSLAIDLARDLKVSKMPVILKASPNSHGHAASVGLPLDLLAFWADRKMRRALEIWLGLTDSKLFHFELSPFFRDFDRLSLDWVRRQKSTAKPSVIAFLRDENHLGELWLKETLGKPIDFGRLGFKQEPGKIRVFAMVNLITQTLMEPLHKWIFARLRQIRTDGTFNQLAPVERLVKGFKGKEFVASYDLSAATDRLPVVIQKALLEPLLGKMIASLWAFLLVGRPYRLPKVAKSYNLGFDRVYYRVGQPMGALSSWAMLALTHHAILQYAAYLAYPSKPVWFQGYALLGDDIVIADKAVASKYLVLMDTLGVEVGLSKSLVSANGSLEFAKRTWVKGQPSSPFSMAEISVASANVGALEELWRKARVYGEIRVAAVARFAGFGYKNLARLPVGFNLNNRLSRLLGFLCRPGGLWPMSFESWVAAIGPGRKVVFDFDTERNLSRYLILDIAKLMNKVLDKVEREVTLAKRFQLTKATFLKKASSEECQRLRIRKGSSIRKGLWGPSFFEGALKWSTYGRRLDSFFEEWVLDPYIVPLSRKYSELRIRLRGFGPEAVHGFNNIDQIWRWIDNLEEGLMALPGKIDLVSRREDVRLAPSALIRLWMKLRRKVRSYKS